MIKSKKHRKNLHKSYHLNAKVICVGNPYDIKVAMFGLYDNYHISDKETFRTKKHFG